MGCCASRAADDSDPRSSGTNGKPFKRAGLKYIHVKPITRKQLEDMRNTFWDTAPTYEGRREIWQALEAAMKASDTSMAQSILEAANIILPTGNPADGCYDELGNRYVIPLYCIVDPTNLIPETSGQSNEEQFDAPKGSTSNISVQEKKDSHITAEESTLTPITIRLSSGRDIKVDISKSDETAGSLKTRIFMQSDVGISAQTHSIRLIYLGRVLKDSDPIIFDKDENVSAGNNVVKLAPGSVLQALIAKKQ